MEIKLGAVKGSYIPVADFDVPSELAKSFCKIYSLDANAERVLTDVVMNNMIAGNIPIGEGSYQSIGDELKSQGHSRKGGSVGAEGYPDSSDDGGSEDFSENFTEAELVTDK